MWSWSHGIQAHSSTSLDNIDTPAANLIKKKKEEEEEMKQINNCWFTNWTLGMEGKESLQKEADNFRLVGGSLISKETFLHMRLV